MPVRASRPARHAIAALSALSIAAAAFGVAPSGARALDVPGASIRAELDRDEISGSGFGGPVTVTITDLTADPVVTEVYGPDRMDDDGRGGFRLQLGDSAQPNPWDLQPGDLVEVAGTGGTRSLVLADLRITAFDLAQNTLAGTSDTAGEVHAQAAHGRTEAEMLAPVLGGSWSADFDDAIPPYDLRVMDAATVAQPDADGDMTVTRLDVLAGARFAFAPDLQLVIGYGWPARARIALTVDRPGTRASPDLKRFGIAGVGGGWAAAGTGGSSVATGEGDIVFSLVGSPLPVEPGDIVTMSDGTTTKTQVIPDLRVGPSDDEAAVLAGSTSVPMPGGAFLVVGRGGSWTDARARHEVPPAPDGTWRGSFTPNPTGIATPAAAGPWAVQVDVDGDVTAVNAPVPQAFVDPARDRVWALDFARAPTTLTITRDGVLVDTITVAAATVYHDGCGSVEMWERPKGTLDRPTAALFDLAGRLDILPGDLLAVSDGRRLVEIAVDRLTVDSANPLTDVATGTADGPVTFRLDDGCGIVAGLGTDPEDGAWNAWFDEAQLGVPAGGLNEGRVLWVIGPGGATRVRWVVGPGPVFGGFRGAVDVPPIVNTIRAGRAVDVRFSLGGDFGLDILAADAPVSERVPPILGPQDAIERTVTATDDGLRYDAVTGEYVYTWVTDPSWAGTYRQFVLTLVDGSTLRADFSLTR